MDVKKFGAKGDGETDDSAAIGKAFSESDGSLFFGRGSYLITRPIEIELSATGCMAIYGEGPARIIMKGSGPAVRIVGTHMRNASPENISEGVWERERMPVVRGLEITGGHPEADGIEIAGTMQAVLSGLLIRNCRHGIHVARHNRNLIIHSCHVYNNSGCGIYFDGVNIHQANVANSHVSYNRRGGIKVCDSEIRNLQIVGNDIEYNYSDESEESADVWFDISRGAIREGTIAGNTIQAVQSPGGANIRMAGPGREASRKVGFFSISGNLISGQENNIHLRYVRGVAISGNSFHSGYKKSILAEYSSNIAVGSNIFDNNPDYGNKPHNGILLDNCRGCTLCGFHFSDAGGEAVVEVKDSSEINMTGCQVLNPENTAVFLKNSSNCRVSGCLIAGKKKPGRTGEPVKVEGGENNDVSGNLNSF